MLTPYVLTYDLSLHRMYTKAGRAPCRALPPSDASASESVKQAPFFPRWFIRSAWFIHRAIYNVSGGRLGLRPVTEQTWGMMRLKTVGRKSGKQRVAILGYFEDGPNLVTLAMNGWGAPEPAWWLNLQARPDTVVEIAGTGLAPRPWTRGNGGGAAAPVGALGRVQRRAFRGVGRAPTRRDGGGHPRAARLTHRRRTAQHAMDHAWEIEDRTAAT